MKTKRLTEYSKIYCRFVVLPTVASQLSWPYARMKKHCLYSRKHFCAKQHDVRDRTQCIKDPVRFEVRTYAHS